MNFQTLQECGIILKKINIIDIVKKSLDLIKCLQKQD